MRPLLTIPVLLLLGSCAVNPVTGKRELSFVSEAQEIQMGQQLLAQSRQQTGFYNDPALAQYISGIGMRMAQASERPQLPWEFHLLDDPVVNAYAAPGGFIFITRGILAYMNSEAELAGVLGHEIGHVTARHSASQMSKQQLMGAGFLIGAIAAPDLAQGVAGQAAMGFSQLLLLKYGRDDESQSDALGHKYSLAAGYDVREMSNTFLTLQRVSAASGGGGPPAFLSSHPDPGDRAAATQRWADTVSSFANLTSGRDRFLDRLNGMVYGDDPRNGYVDNGRFIHPTLRFQFAVPSGWQVINQASRVVAVEPNGRGQLEFTQAEGRSAQAAAATFAAQQGLTVLSSGPTTVNGLPAFGVAFRATSGQEGQVIEGEAVFIDYNGAVWRMMGLVVPSAAQAIGGALGRSIRSFGPTAANQTFQRVREIRIVTPSGPTTATSLASQSGGAITAQELALINSIEADQRIPAGRKLKTVRYR
jgi:predicted Zn-dependent protease